MRLIIQLMSESGFTGLKDELVADPENESGFTELKDELDGDPENPKILSILI